MSLLTAEQMLTALHVEVVESGVVSTAVKVLRLQDNTCSEHKRYEQGTCEPELLSCREFQGCGSTAAVACRQNCSSMLFDGP
jgi:hypothetical protein